MKQHKRMRDPSPRQPAGSVPPPAAFLFRPAWPAVSGTDLLSGAFWTRQTDGVTCGSDETTCPQGGWCCGAGESCSLQDGAFFCCAAGADKAGCARVCATGDFQCGSICCAKGQTCMAADTLSPYCVNESRTSVISTSATTTTATTATTTTTTTTTTTSSSSLASTTRPSSSRTSSNSVTTSATPVSSSESLPSTDGQTAAPSNTLSTSTSAHHPSSTSTPTATAGPHNKGGLPLSAQIAVGVVIPVAVILLVGALWFFAFRRPNRAHNGPGHRRWGTGGTASSGFATGSRGPTPPPTYDKSGLDVVVVEPPSSLYEQQQQQYATAPDAEHGRERAAVGEEFELADLRGPAGGLGNGGVSDGARSRAGGTREVSPLSDASSGGPRGQMPPHPGDVVVV